jgi:hypothetical protein
METNVNRLSSAYLHYGRAGIPVDEDNNKTCGSLG